MAQLKIKQKILDPGWNLFYNLRIDYDFLIKKELNYFEKSMTNNKKDMDPLEFLSLYLL